MASICILGGTGMLGASLVPFLRDLGHKVVCFSRKPKDGEAIAVDYSNDNSLERALDACKPSFVINLAALTNVDECEKYPHLAYSANVQIVETISRWIKKNPSCYLIQISTDHIYDGFGPHTEDKIKIVNYYGFSKYSGELAAALVPSTILRTNFFGKSKCPLRKSFSDWAFDSLHKGKQIKVFTDVQFSPLSIKYLAKYINLVISNPISGTFNLGSRDGFSKAKFVFTLAKSFNFSTKNVLCSSFKSLGLTAPRPSDMRMDCSKFEATYKCLELPTLEDQIMSIKGDYINEIG
ncbi:SDR family oxidoreductase [Amylibacter sp.]|nr:SDR family oxidoreductase [Amylibacter sp.]